MLTNAAISGAVTIVLTLKALITATVRITIIWLMTDIVALVSQWYYSETYLKAKPFV